MRSIFLKTPFEINMYMYINFSHISYGPYRQISMFNWFVLINKKRIELSSEVDSVHTTYIIINHIDINLDISMLKYNNFVFEYFL